MANHSLRYRQVDGEMTPPTLHRDITGHLPQGMSVRALPVTMGGDILYRAVCPDAAAAAAEAGCCWAIIMATAVVTCNSAVVVHHESDASSVHTHNRSIKLAIFALSILFKQQALIATSSNLLSYTSVFITRSNSSLDKSTCATTAKLRKRCKHMHIQSNIYSPSIFHWT
jgi:hypothetical protein